MYENERSMVLEACRRMVNDKLTVGSWGNISLRTDDNNVIITPSGTNYLKSSLNDMIVTDLSGNVLEGKLKPSSERLMHYEIYKNRKDVNAIVHTHSIFSSVLAVINEDIPAITEDIAMLLGDNIKVSEYALTGTMELAKNVVKGLKNNNATIMKNHGAVTVGSDMERAIVASEVLEKSANIYIYSRIMGKINKIPDDDINKLKNMSENYLKQWDNWK